MTRNEFWWKCSVVKCVIFVYSTNFWRDFMWENLWLCWKNNINQWLEDCWVSIVSSVNALFSRACLLTFYHKLSSDSAGVINLCNVVSLLIMRQEMWLERSFLWLTGLPTQILYLTTQDGQAGNLLSPFQSMCISLCVFCAVNFYMVVVIPPKLWSRKLTIPYDMLFLRCLCHFM